MANLQKAVYTSYTQAELSFLSADSYQLALLAKKAVLLYLDPSRDRSDPPQPMPKGQILRYVYAG